MAEPLNLFPRREDIDPTATNRARAVLGQGLGMNWGDEAEAWLRSRMGQGTYEDQLSKIRGEYAQYSKESPVVSGALEFAGGALPGVAMMAMPGGQPAGAATIQRSTLATLGKLGALGGVTGAVSGAGNAEGDNRLNGATSGGLIGTTMGIALPVATRAAGAGRKWLMERLAPTEARVNEKAAGKMNQALRESEMSPADIQTKLLEDRRMNVPSRVLNVSQGTADLAEAVAQRTGSGARKLENGLNSQKAGTRERTFNQVNKGLNPGDYYSDEQKLVENLRNKAKTLYDDAYSHGEVNDPRINAVLENPVFAGFFDKAKKIADSEAMAAKLRGEDPSRFMLKPIYLADEAGNVKVGSLPDVRTLDYMKRGIDATIDAGFRGQGMSTAEASALRDLRKQFVSAIDENVPAYKTARQTYAGDMEVGDAMRAGMNDFNKLDHEQVIKLVAGMSSAEKDAYRTGVARNLYGRIMEPSGNLNAAQRLIGSPEMQAKMQPLFDNPAHFELFKNSLERESQLFHQANKVLGGSPTGKRLQMRENLEEGDGIGQAISGAVSGGFRNSLANMAITAVRNTDMNEKTASKLADMLLAKDPHEVAAVVKLLEDQAANTAPKALRAGKVEAGLVTGAMSAGWPTATGEPSSAQLDINAGPVGISPEEANTLHNEMIR